MEFYFFQPLYSATFLNIWHLKILLAQQEQSDPLLEEKERERKKGV